MAIGVSALATISSGTDATSYTSPAFIPSASELLVAVYHTTRTSAQPTTPTVSGQDGTIGWTLIDSHYYVTSGSTRTMMFIFAAISSSSPVSGTTSFDHGATTHVGAECSLYEVSGANEPNGLVQTFAQVVKTVADSAAGLSAAITLAAAQDSDNRPFSAFVHHANEVLTVPQPLWTEIHDVAHGAPAMDLESQWRSDAFDTAAGATWTTSSLFGGMAWEIKTLAAGGGGGSQQMPVRSRTRPIWIR